MKLGWWLLAIAAICVLGVVVTALLVSDGARSESRPQAVIDLPEVPAVSIAAPTLSVKFHETAEAAGLRFEYRNGARGQYHLTETLGGGVALLDYDRDGWLDVYLVQGGEFPASASNPYGNRLFRNQGDGAFADVTESAGVGDNGYGQGCAVGDIDNDGHPDLYVTNFGPDVLYRNNGDGTFTDVTAAAGLGCALSGTSCAFGDLDGDGDLDLYVANYVEIDFDHPKVCGVEPARIYCPPPYHPAQPDVVYRNNGDGTFTDVTVEAGIHDEEGRGLGALIADVNGDGHQDIYVANDATANYLFVGDGSLHFEERALESGLAVGRDGRAEGSMGIAYGDYDGDAATDLLVTNFVDETNTLYRSAGSGLFVDGTGPAGLGPPTRSLVGWGTQFVDFNNDGQLELFVANGNVNDIEAASGEQYAMLPQLFARGGDALLVNVAAGAGPYFERRWSGRGAAFGDVDGDARQDIVVSHLNEPAALLRNASDTMGAVWTLRLIGRADSQGGSSRDAVGARIEADTDSLRLVREVVGGGSYLSASPLPVHLGLGQTTKLERLQIRWPSGRRQVWQDLTVEGDAVWTVVEGEQPVPADAWRHRAMGARK